MKRDIELVPDPVLTWKRKKQSDWLQKHSLHGKIIAVSVRHWNAKRRLYKKVSDGFKKIKARRIPNFICPDAWSV